MRAAVPVLAALFLSIHRVSLALPCGATSAFGTGERIAAFAPSRGRTAALADAFARPAAGELIATHQATALFRGVFRFLSHNAKYGMGYVLFNLWGVPLRQFGNFFTIGCGF
jgi:hypothetical protein